ncbi:hypothetical protein J0H58_13035 [bacterium]|nr:hypothetical protein [bacterium]
MDRHRANVLKWLQSLPDSELVDVFYEALGGRSGPDEWSGACESRLALIHAARERAGDGWGEWSVALVCPAPGFAPGAPLCQTGAHCGFSTTSCGKRSRCPLCGGDVYGI